MAIAIDHAAIFFTIVEAHLARSSSSSTAAAPSFGPDGPELGFDATQDAITGLKGWKLAVAPFFLYWILAWYCLVWTSVGKPPMDLAPETATRSELESLQHTSKILIHSCCPREDVMSEFPCATTQYAVRPLRMLTIFVTRLVYQ